MPRKPSIASTALALIESGGPQTIEELAPQVVAAGLTRARDPLAAVLRPLTGDQRFLAGADGRWYSTAAQLEGAIFARRLAPIERRCEVVILTVELTMVSRLLEGRRRRLGRGGDVGTERVDRYFGLAAYGPYDDDYYHYDDRVPWCEIDALPEDEREAAFEILLAHEFATLLTGPPGWLPDLVGDHLHGIIVRGGALEMLALSPADIDPAHVALAARRMAAIAHRQIGPDPSWFGPPSISLAEVLEMVAIEAPEILRQPLPPLAEVLAQADLELVGGVIGHRGTDWERVHWLVRRTPEEAWGFEPAFAS